MRKRQSRSGRDASVPRSDIFELPPAANEGGGGPDASRVEALFRDHNDDLVSFLRTRLRNDSDAREAAQETYVRLLSLDQPEQPSFLRGYLFRIASNVATDIMRRRAVRQRKDEADPEPPVTPATQEHALVARQQLLIVDRVLRQLPPRCREAFLLSRQDGWTAIEIAQHLGVSDRMVRTYLLRALEQIQCALDNS